MNGFVFDMHAHIRVLWTWSVNNACVHLHGGDKDQSINHRGFDIISENQLSLKFKLLGEDL